MQFPLYKRAAPVGKESKADQISPLRQLSAEFKDLYDLLESAGKGEIALKEHDFYIGKTKTDIESLLKKFQDDENDAIRHVLNLWEQIAENPVLKSPKESIPSEQQRNDINLVNNRIRKIIFYLSTLTIPERLNKWLDGAWPGYYVPFHLVFEDEIPSLDDRNRLLKYLAYSPKALDAGLVNLGSGVIYRYSRHLSHRLFSLLAIMLIFLFATACIYFSGNLSLPESGINIWKWHIPLYIQGWPISPSDQSTLLISWIALLIGIIVHVSVGAAKSEQKEGIPPLLSTQVILPYVNAKFGWLLWKLGLALIGFFGFVFAYGTHGISAATVLGNVTTSANATLLDNLTVINNIIIPSQSNGLGNASAFTAFLIGYSLDSVVELFGTSLDQRSIAQVAALKKKLGVTDEESTSSDK